ncbi:leucine-rich repeat domain-containing protein [Actibacterium pelagium]|uniref:Leucine-rich repeat domain-containing protein n=1 Tax=Actibacterium pelagium TaxID=2029103 RepID=A0A917AKC8_9RHOB|nr:leucine-rich repeat domain-containing protein [Actibacterium pelagium]GGE58811.1 hypothetical protein GCM10011517_28080 [Actibacterium pelagium]
MGLGLLAKRGLQFLALMLVIQTVLVANSARVDHAKAEKRIDAAAENGQTVLDLSELMNLRKIPDDIARIENLSRLDLSDTSVADLSPLREQTRLQYLTVRNSRVEDLTPLSELPSLRHLVISRSQVHDLNPLADTPRLERLAVGGLELYSLEPLTRMSSLRWLNLHAAYARDGSNSYYRQLTAEVPEVYNGSAFQQNYVPGPMWLLRTWLTRTAEDAGLRHPSARSR